jgi:transcriptional regulator with XRE-family HTH domain
MTQKELGDLGGVARTSIQAIELGKLKLSPGLAHKISRATGVNYSWLIDNDPSRPIINHAGGPYTEKDFALAQDEDSGVRRLSTYHSQRGRLCLAQAYYLLRRLLDDYTAAANNELADTFFLQRLEQFVRAELRERPLLQNQLTKELGQKWRAIIAQVAPGYRYPRTFLTPPDTQSCELMARDSKENRLTIRRYQKEILADAKKQQAVTEPSSPRPASVPAK